MRIINRIQYTTLCDSVYRGRIELTKKEFDYAINHILKNKQVSNNIDGSGKYPYLSKSLLKEDIKKGKNNIYCLRVGFAEYIQNLFKNKTKYNYKRQNYLIKICEI